MSLHAERNKKRFRHPLDLEVDEVSSSLDRSTKLTQVSEQLGSDQVPKPSNLVELRMNLLSYALRSKENWQSKRLDATIAEKWAKEAEAQVILDGRLSRECVAIVIRELAAYEQLVDPENGIQVSFFY